MATLEKQKSSRSLGTVEYIIKYKSIFSDVVHGVYLVLLFTSRKVRIQC